MTILDRFRELHYRSIALYEDSLRAFPSGVTHDVRFLKPAPIYVERATGSRKWDVDENEIIDYVMGHGALFFGHSHPTLVEAVSSQVSKGTHYGANHKLELRWSELVRDFIPSAEAVRFTSSGTEATQMAIRLARAYTGREKILKFDHHFHGWTDSLVGKRMSEEETPSSAGVPVATLANTISVPQDNLQMVHEYLASNDVAAVILEPTGASWGTLPLSRNFLSELRTATKKWNTLLIFDEVITGFRVSSGGAQKEYAVMPDLTTLAKILAGGLPGGAVAGQADILAMIEFRDDAEWNQRHRVAHPGTYNANPLSTAAGVAMLSQLKRPELYSQVNTYNKRLMEGLNSVIKESGLAGCVYGLASYFHILLGKDYSAPADNSERNSGEPPRMNAEVGLALRQAMLNHGIDLMGLASAGSAGGFVSIAHTAGDIEKTIGAFKASLKEMAIEGLI